jgi:hypothetical protein
MPYSILAESEAPGAEAEVSEAETVAGEDDVSGTAAAPPVLTGVFCMHETIRKHDNARRKETDSGNLIRQY